MSYRDFDEFLIRLEQDDHVESVGDSGGKTVAGPRGRTPVTVHTSGVIGAKIVRHAFATRRRVAWALQVEEIAEVAGRFDRMLDLSVPHTLSSLMDRASEVMSSLRIVPAMRRRTNNDLQSVESDIFRAVANTTGDSLVGTMFPARDDHPYWGVHVAPTSSEDKVLVLSPYRLDEGERVAVTLGGDPAALVAALMPLPTSFHRSYFTGWLRKRPSETMRLNDPAVDVPVNVEGVLVGTIERVDVRSDAHESPNRIRYAATVLVHDVRLKPNPVLVSLSDRDTTVLREAMIEMSLPLIRVAVPEMRAMHTRGGVALISVDGDESAALRSAYTFLASPFTDATRWIVTCGVSSDGAWRAVLPDAGDVRLAASAAHPDNGREVPVFIESKSDTPIDASAWLPEYQLAVSAWRDASDRLED